MNSIPIDELLDLFGDFTIGYNYMGDDKVGYTLTVSSITSYSMKELARLGIEIRNIHSNNKSKIIMSCKIKGSKK